MPKAILFDFDGPLADSLNPHIDFLLRMSSIYGGPSTLPKAEDTEVWKNLSGYPMTRFMENVGFTKEQAKQIFSNEYDAEFANHPSPLYIGVPKLINGLKNRGFILGIISLNLRVNILASLGNITDVFRVIHSADEFAEKTSALTDACQILQIKPVEAVYIGDAPKDYEAAHAVGMPFIGVAYGWQITGREKEYISARNPAELESMLAFLD